MSRQKVIAVVGPTSSGKTALGIALAKKFNGEVISADSRQVYRGLNLGTGKVTKKEMAGVPHHLLDVADPKRQFSAGDFVTKGEKAIVAISKRGRLPIIVGGTGFYLDALLSGIVLPAVPPNKKLRKELEKKTTPQLLAQLRRLDIHRAKEIDHHNRVRLIRSIEIAQALGNVPQLNRALRYNTLWIGLALPEHELKKKISARLKARLKQGMIAEAKRLHTKGLSYKRMHVLGLEYRWLSLLLQEKISRKEFETGLERDINRYVKRQMRWLKRNKDIHWIQDEKQAVRLASSFLYD